MLPAKQSFLNTTNILLLSAFLMIALFWNLGSRSIMTDEPTRTVVAQELDLSNNLIVPTINGVKYFKKPPLYNWLILAAYKITGSKSEWVTRIMTVISLLLFCWAIFDWTKKYFNKETAVIAAIIFITGGRIFFYDSMLGLIDSFFGLLIFLTFRIIVEGIKKENYFKLFILSYFLIACCFLMKGLQALAFQGVTLLACFIYYKKFKKLISLAHISGLLLFICILGAYFYAYHKHYPLDLLFQTYWSESSSRTVNAKPWYEGLIHILTFPVRIIFLDILPFGIVLLALFKKEVRKAVLQNKFIIICLVITVANSLVYWISPETRGRYLFPHYALLAIVGAEIINQITLSEKLKILLKKNLSIILITLVPLITIIPFISSFLGLIDWSFSLDQIVLWPLICVLTLFICLQKERHWFFKVSLFIFFLRIGFDTFIIPFRKETEGNERYKQDAIRIARNYNDRELFVLHTNYVPISHSTTHYVTVEQNRILPSILKRPKKGPNYYIVQGETLKDSNFVVLDSFNVRYQNFQLFVVERKDELNK